MSNMIIWTEKHRPSTLDEIILLPRIKNIFKEGIKANYILKGQQGLGKSSLANILLKNNPHKYFHSKQRIGINDIQEKINDFCSEYNPFDDRDKIIFFDEFVVTRDFQEAIRGFIESSSAKGVRWLITTNYPEEIIPPLRSRFREIDFHPKDNEEVEFLKNGYKNKIINILKLENKSIDDSLLNKIIERYFPDMRKITDVCEAVLTEKDIFIASEEDTYLIFEEKITRSEKLWDRCLPFKGKELNVLRQMGTPFINYILKKRKDKIHLIPFIAMQFKEHETLLKESSDPLVILFSFVHSVNQKFLE